MGARWVRLRLSAVLFVEVARRYLDGLKGFTPLTEEVNHAGEDKGGEAPDKPPPVERIRSACGTAACRNWNTQARAAPDS
jgi:hypothetical protein